MTVNLGVAWKQMQAMLNSAVALLPNLLIALVVLFIFAMVGRYVARGVRAVVSRSQAAPGAALVIGRFAQYVVAILGFLIALSILFPSFQAAELVQVLGIGGVAIGFAFKDIFQNFLAGVIILLSRPFRLGDQIQVNDYEGTVEDIQTRATMIRTYDNRRIVIPNITLFTEEVTVLTGYEKRRSEYDLGIGYGDDIDTAKDVILNVLQRTAGIEEDPAPDVLVWGLDDNWVTLRIRWWTTPRRANVLYVRDEVLCRVKNDLTEQGIDIPFPTRVILLHNQTEEVDGDRSGQREGWPAGKQKVPKPRVTRHVEDARISEPDSGRPAGAHDQQKS